VCVLMWLASWLPAGASANLFAWALLKPANWFEKFDLPQRTVLKETTRRAIKEIIQNLAAKQTRRQRWEARCALAHIIGQKGALHKVVDLAVAHHKTLESDPAYRYALLDLFATIDKAPAKSRRTSAKHLQGLTTLLITLKCILQEEMKRDSNELSDWINLNKFEHVTTLLLKHQGDLADIKREIS
jgi:hypothetical protein